MHCISSLALKMRRISITRSSRISIVLLLGLTFTAQLHLVSSAKNSGIARYATRPLREVLRDTPRGVLEAEIKSLLDDGLISLDAIDPPF